MRTWTAEEVVPGVRRLPGSTQKIMGYALAGAHGRTLVIDPAWADPASMAADLAAVGSTADELAGVVFTHAHPDFYRFGDWIRKHTGCWLALHTADATRLSAVAADAPHTSAEAWLTAAGVPEQELADLLNAIPADEGTAPRAIPEIRLGTEDAPVLDAWGLEVIHTPGHTPGHVCIHDRARGHVFVGDHVLPRTTPNISRNHHSTADPLGDYLGSLTRLGDLVSPGTTVLPGRQGGFRDLPHRVGELLAHHDARLREALTAVTSGTGGRTAWEVAERLTWSRGWERTRGFARRAALGETEAHLARLEATGGISRTAEHPTRWTVR
ncbi:MBL fold metallo-hydrolase [Streptomyces sp. NPDC059627]